MSSSFVVCVWGVVFAMPFLDMLFVFPKSKTMVCMLVLQHIKQRVVCFCVSFMFPENHIKLFVVVCMLFYNMSN